MQINDIKLRLKLLRLKKLYLLKPQAVLSLNTIINPSVPNHTHKKSLSKSYYLNNLYNLNFSMHHYAFLIKFLWFSLIKKKYNLNLKYNLKYYRYFFINNHFNLFYKKRQITKIKDQYHKIFIKKVLKIYWYYKRYLGISIYKRSRKNFSRWCKRILNYQTPFGKIINLNNLIIYNFEVFKASKLFLAKSNNRVNLFNFNRKGFKLQIWILKFQIWIYSFLKKASLARTALDIIKLKIIKFGLLLRKKLRKFLLNLIYFLKNIVYYKKWSILKSYIKGILNIYNVYLNNFYIKNKNYSKFSFILYRKKKKKKYFKLKKQYKRLRRITMPKQYNFIFYINNLILNFFYFLLCNWLNYYIKINYDYDNSISINNVSDNNLLNIPYFFFSFKKHKYSYLTHCYLTYFTPNFFLLYVRDLKKLKLNAS